VSSVSPSPSSSPPRMTSPSLQTSNHPSDPSPRSLQASSAARCTVITHYHPEAPDSGAPELSYTSILWPVHYVQNTAGAELLPESKKEQLHAVIKKGIDERVEMYSTFADPFKWIHPEVHPEG
jgi:nicotinamidase-related amidase